MPQRDLSSLDRINAALADPLNALDGDNVTVSGSDLADVVTRFDAIAKALGDVASPSFRGVPEMRRIARDALMANVRMYGSFNGERV